jgi:hypothetical protein
MKFKRTVALCLGALFAAFMLIGCGSDNSSNSTSVQAGDGESNYAEAVTVQTMSAEVIEFREAATIDLSSATEITLNGSSVNINGSGASENDGVISVTEAGTYVFSGSLDDGRIIVDAKGMDVILVLNGAEISCSYSSPIYIYKAAHATIHIMADTENSLSDGAEYSFSDDYSSEDDNEPNACIYSKSDLTMQGAGALTVKANHKNALNCKDELEIYDLALDINAEDKGIIGKDSCLIDSVKLNIDCKGDAISSSNSSDDDTELGQIDITASVININTDEDGIQAETNLSITSGSFTVTTGGGSSVKPDDSVSTKGIKAGGSINISGGSFTMECSDDAFHAGGDVCISGGSFTVSTYDDAFHSDENLTVDNGVINVLTSYEGLEGTTVTINDGTIHIVSSDDGINAAGGNDQSGFMGFGGKNKFGGGSSTEYCISINGGYIYVQADGDGLDSNGNITMASGTVIVSSSGSNDAPVDYDGSFEFTGGTLLAMDNGQMTQAPSSATQNVISVSFGQSVPAGSYVSIQGDGLDFVFQLPCNTTAFVYSSPELATGADYSISYGGSYSGDVVDCLCSGGSYSGGTDLTTMNLSDTISTFGTSGMMGMGGGKMGGGDGGRMGGMDMPQNDGQMTDGDMPEMPDGNAPEMPDGGDFGSGQNGFDPGNGTQPEMKNDFGGFDKQGKK